LERKKLIGTMKRPPSQAWPFSIGNNIRIVLRCLGWREGDELNGSGDKSMGQGEKTFAAIAH
jgi:hypothetical protein